MQSDTQMCEQMKKAQLLVSPSSIENSPNTVGEAMLMWLPVISSNVGGVSTMLKNQIGKCTTSVFITGFGGCIIMPV